MTVTQERPAPSAAEPPPRRFDVDLAIRIVAALLAAGAICGLAFYLYPEHLSIHTDIVGYPIFQDYNSRRSTFEYLLIAVAFPAIAIAIFSGLEVWARRRAGARPGWPGLPTASVADEPESEPNAGQAAAVPYLKAAAVGLLIALAVAISTGASSSWPWALAVPIALGYVLIARGAGALIARARPVSIDRAMAGVNAVIASAGLLAVAAAAAAAHVDVTGPGVTVDYPFAPPWALVVVGLIPVAAVGTVVWRSATDRWARIETWTLLLVVAPVAVYLGLAMIRGELPPPDLFHEGERLGASHLVLDTGRFPWRDVLFTHGVLSDVLFPGLDTGTIDHSRWGLIAGQGLVERPLFWLSTFALCVYLFRRNWLFLAGIILLLSLGWLDQLDNTRMILVPLSLLAVAALLVRSTWPRAFALMAVTGAQAIMVPEATVYSVAVWAVVVVYELVNRRLPDASGLRTSRSLRIVIAGAVLLAAFVVYLAANDAVHGFIDYYTTFVGGHDLTGAFPILWSDLQFHVWVYIPVVAILAAWAYAAARVWSGRWLTTADWVVAAGVIGLIPYYLKFLDRPDSGHLYQVGAVAVIPALYVVYRLVQVADARAKRTGRAWLSYRPATLALVVLVVAFAPASGALTTVRDLPARYVGTASTIPPDPRLGYIIPGNDEQLIRQVQAVVDRYAPDGDVFDFTNSPLLFSYLVNDRPATRYFHVSMAIPAAAQEDLIDELRDEDPPLVAYSSQVHGLPSWDAISNPVRHYLVSGYLLDHYHPVARVDDYVFMARDRDPAAPPEVKDPNGLLFAGLPCEWAYAPNFLDQAPPSGAPAAPLDATRVGTSTGVGGWAVDVAADRPVEKVLVANGDRVIATAPTGVRRDDVVTALRSPGVLYSGFEFRELLPARYAQDPQSLSYFGLTGDGVASELGEPTSPPPAALRMPGGARVPVDQEAARGSIDYTLAPMDRYKLSGATDFHPYDWLSVNAAAGPDGSRFIVSDGDAGGLRGIGWAALAGRDSERVRVGACPQWKGYANGPIYLDVSRGTGPVEATLIR
ncbi:MAG: hypothetical protein ACJ75R_03045 [Solirubrobacterales bacterium]